MTAIERDTAFLPLDEQPVWVPEPAPWDDARGARIDIEDERLRRLVIHHMAQAGTFVHASCPTAVRITTLDATPTPGTVYVAESPAAICDHALYAERVGPTGLAAVADLDQLPSIVTGVMSGITCRGNVAAAVLSAARTMTGRSLQVLELVARGHTNAEIAERLNYSLTTIKRDIAHLFDVFGSTSRRELVRSATSTGLIAGPWGALDASWN